MQIRASLGANIYLDTCPMNCPIKPMGNATVFLYRCVARQRNINLIARAKQPTHTKQKQTINHLFKMTYGDHKVRMSASKKAASYGVPPGIIASHPFEKN
jgi:hypothetical protein